MSELRRWERPPLNRTAPNRGAGNFYRSGSDNATVVGGVPLDSVEAAVTAAVRMGYKIAEAQIERTARLGKRLREAGDQAAGPHSDRKALDATEQLVFRALMAGLGWLEGLASERGSPLRRLATSQYQIIGSLLGLTPADAREAPTTRNGRDGGGSTPVKTRRSPPALRIRHKGVKRAVEVRDWQLAADITPGEYPLTFYAGNQASGIAGVLTVGGRQPGLLTLEAPQEAVSGFWKAAICDADGLQVGHIEIAL
jgi:hypothetical protein